MEKELPFFICVHVGAGYHHKHLEKSYKKIMKLAIKTSGAILSSTGDTVKAVTTAIKILENSPLTNAGKGSNLNFDGDVECDASLMTGDGLFGAIGATPGIKNPINVAASLALESRLPMPFNRVRPIFLSGEGALKWASERHHKVALTKLEAEKLLVTKEAVQKWKVYKTMLNNIDESKINISNNNNNTAIADEMADDTMVVVTEQTEPGISFTDTDKNLNDTIGCIAINHKGETCAGVSSGGIILKTPGRIGEAAVYGAGCWAENSNSREIGSPAIACSVSGVGENISRSQIAKACATALIGNYLIDGNVQDLVRQEVEKWQEPKEVGIITLKTFTNYTVTGKEMQLEFSVIHNTESMGFGYMVQGQKPVAKFSRHDGHSGSIVETGGYFKWNVT